MHGRVSLARWDDLPLEHVTEMVARKALVGADLTLVQIYLKKGALVPLHAHAAEQFIYVLRGALHVVADGTSLTIREGEVLRLPAGTPHQAEALDDTFVFDIRGRAADATKP
jgi:quercetin dioxygenase-like cupin family protein